MYFLGMPDINMPDSAFTQEKVYKKNIFKIKYLIKLILPKRFSLRKENFFLQIFLTPIHIFR